ncbi:MAG TPA: ORF6N domain-containing protein [Chthoniobacteraceae bacterium]|jgi:hypothetical protein|nr:ORF6N domain-containing protein [Chthoniobacteraceae bacterium]
MKKKTAPPVALPDAPLIPIREVRGQRVLLDSDLAALYGVPTSRFNEAIKRNGARFPSDFLFRLTKSEAAALGLPPADALISQNAISKPRRGGRRKLPYAFTEHGALMAANLIKSERAVAMSVYVIRAFVQLREQVLANAAILQRLAEIDKTLLEHDTALRAVWTRLQPLLSPPPDPPKPRIGFDP